MADVTSIEVGIDTFLEDMWEDMWGYTPSILRNKY